MVLDLKDKELSEKRGILRVFKGIRGMELAPHPQFEIRGRSHPQFLDAASPVVGKTSSRGGVNREREKFPIRTPPPRLRVLHGKEKPPAPPLLKSLARHCKSKT